MKSWWTKGKKWLWKMRLQPVESFRNNGNKSLSMEMEVVSTPPPYAGRYIIWTIAALLMVTALWMLLGTVDEVAVTQGKLIPNGYVRVLQAEDKGIIRNIYVKEGQFVHQGDVLLELDPTVSESDLAKIKENTAHARLEVERLRAEKEGKPFNPAVTADGESVDAKDVENERNLYQSRLFQYQMQLRSAEALVSQHQNSLRSAQIEAGKAQAVYGIEADKEQRYASLLKDHAISEVGYLNQQEKRVEAENTYYSQQQAVGEQQAALAKSQADCQQIQAARSLDIDSSLAQAEQMLYQLEQELKKADEKHDLIQIVAPDDGYVSNLTVHTLGGIVTSAQTLMELVPENVSMEVESWAENKDIGFIQEGQEAEIKVESFNYQKYGTIRAQVASVSPNPVEDPEKGRVYRLILMPEADSIEVEDKKVRLSSGMNVTAEIKTEHKHIYEYFLEPFKKYKSEFLRERA